MKSQTGDDVPKDIGINVDKKIEKMVAEWDIVRCHYCKKKISMLDAIMISNEYFVCKGH